MALLTSVVAITVAVSNVSAQIACRQWPDPRVAGFTIVHTDAALAGSIARARVVRRAFADGVAVLRAPLVLRLSARGWEACVRENGREQGEGAGVGRFVVGYRFEASCVGRAGLEELDSSKAQQSLLSTSEKVVSRPSVTASPSITSSVDVHAPVPSM